LNLKRRETPGLGRRRKVSSKKACIHVRLAGKTIATKLTARKSQTKPLKKIRCLKNTESSRKNLNLRGLLKFTKITARSFNATREATNGVSMSRLTRPVLFSN